MSGGAHPIHDLALIGDRRTAAIISTAAAVLWYCPERFDRPALLASLLDPDRGGAWTVDLAGSTPDTRSYREDSAVLDTTLRCPGGELVVSDWMPLGADSPRGICRMFSPAPTEFRVMLSPAPDYAARVPTLQSSATCVSIDNAQWLYASHPLTIAGATVMFCVPEGEVAWAVLADAPLTSVTGDAVRGWREETLDRWRGLSAQVTYRGPYEREVASSLRALRLLTYAPNGGVIAAATTSLPELMGGNRNYDYRYVWLRDTGMIVSALVRAGSTGPDEQRFLGFICSSRQENSDAPLLPPFLTLDSEPAPCERNLDLAGYASSQPVRLGNNASAQLQLGGFANVLLAAKLIYEHHDTRDHWETVRAVADFLVEHWREPDNGIWEEHQPQQYTTSKVITSCGLRYIAGFAESEAQAERWRGVAAEIAEYVARHCLNSEGAYAAVRGGEAVDVSAVLFPIWGFVAADAPEVLATMRVLERDYSVNHLYWRHLEELAPRTEGAFLAGTIWVAQYWIMRKELERARAVLDASLAYANDLGFFAEEADPSSGRMLGNFPQAFVHAAFIGAAVDYRNAIEH